MPFLNSVRLLPSERATDGNRLPNRQHGDDPHDHHFHRANSEHRIKLPAARRASICLIFSETGCGQSILFMFDLIACRVFYRACRV